MAEEIQNLQINITAGINDAKSAVNDLKTGVIGLKDAVAQIEAVSPQLISVTSSLKTLSNSAKNVARLIESLGSLETACRSLNSVNFSQLTANSQSLIEALRPLEEFGTNSIGGVINSFKTINDAVMSVGSIEDMSGFGENVTQLASAMSAFNGVDPKSTGSAIRNLGKLPAILQQLDHVGDVEAKLRDIASSLKPLEELGKSNLSSFTTQLEKIPRIVQNLNPEVLAEFKVMCEELAVAMSPLAEQIDKIGTSFGRLPQNVRSASTAMNQLNGSTSGRSSGGGGIFSGRLNGITRAIAKFWLLKTAISQTARAFTRLFEASADYTETVHLFSVAMGDAAVSADAFAERVQSAMGIDKKEWMDYQGTLNMLVTGFGVASDKAQIMSQNLTQLAYDYSSLLNVDVSDAFKKIESAMSGQIKGLKEYGNNVSVAMVKQTGLKYGLQGSVSSWDNQTQAIMRYITIMNNAAHNNVYGDLARTITTPANAFRILRAQANQMIRALGAIGSVIMARVIPYLQILAQVVTRVAMAIARFFGYKMPKIDTSGISSAATATDNLDKGLGNTGNSGNKAAKGIDKANKAAKKLKNTTQSWDELHVMPENDPTANTGTGGAGGGGGLGGGGAGGLESIGDIELPAYDFFKGLEEDANKKIEAIMKKLRELFKPIQDSWNQYGKGVIDAFRHGWESIGSLVTSVAKSFNEVWQNGTGKKTFDEIFQIVTNIVEAIATMADNFTEAWNKGGQGVKIVQNLWDAFNAALGIVKELTRMVRDIASYFNWTPVLRLAESALDSIKTVIKGVQVALRNVWDKGGRVFAEGIIDLANGVISLADGILRKFVNPLLKAFTKLFSGVLAKSVGVALGAIGNLLKILGGLLSLVSKSSVAMNVLGLAITAIGSASVVASIMKTVAQMGGLASAVSTVASNFLNFTSIGRTVTSTFASMGSMASSVSSGIGLLASLANPVTLTVTALGAALAIGAQLASHYTAVGNTIKGCSQAVQNEAKAIQSYNDEVNSAIDSAHDTVADALTKIEVFDQLSAKLDSVTDKKGYVKNMSQAKSYVQQINSIMPNTVKITKDGKIEWTKTSKEIKKAKDNIKKAALEQAKMALYTEITKKQIKATQKLNEQKELEAKYVKQANAQYDSYVAKCKQTGETVKITREEWVKNNTQVNEQRILIGETEKVIESLNGKYKTIDKTVAQFAETTKTSSKKSSENGKKAAKGYVDGYTSEMGSENSKKKAKSATKKLSEASQKQASKTKITFDSKYKDDGKKKTKSHKASMQKEADKSKVSVNSKYKDNGSSQTKSHKKSMQKEADKSKVGFGTKTKQTGASLAKGFASAMQTEANKTKNTIKMKAKVTGSFESAGKSAASSWKSGFKKALSSDNIAKIVFKYGGAKSSGSVSIKPYAMGGQPVSGEMFLARENGIPEMVGRIGNTTTVMNNDQIVEAVSSGVASAFGAYVPEIIRAINNQDHGVYIDGRELTRKIMSTQKAMGNDFGFNY